jgi:DNA-binding CsgD family transcriptional regulator
MNAQSDLLDHVYEAAVVPEKWPAVLEMVCGVCDAQAGGLLYVGPGRLPVGLMTEGYRATYEDFAVNGGRYANVRMERAMLRNHPGFLRDVDLCTLAELEADPIYRDFLRPHGLGWTVGTAVVQPEGRIHVFDFGRSIDRGPVAAASLPLLDELRPHLARAALLAARIAHECAEVTTRTLADLGLPAAVLGRDGSILVANPEFEAFRARLDRDEVATARGPIDFDQLMYGATAAADPDGGGAVRSLPLPAKDGAPRHVVHLIPIRRSARDIFVGATTIAVIVAVAPSPVPSADLIGSLFDLTPAETRVVRAVAAGSTLADHATASHITVETVRSQLKIAMAKIGVGRQVDLVRLVLGAAAPFGGVAR